MIEEIHTDQKSTIREKIQLSVEKRIRAWFKQATSALSITNASMSFITNSINFIIRPIVAANVMLSNIGISVFFNAISLSLNTYSLVNYFREKKILKKFGIEKTPEEEKRSKNKLQVICLDLLCDMFFLAAAVTSIALFGNPIALFVSMPFLVLGGLVMAGSIVKSTINQVREFKHYLSQHKGEGKEELLQLYREGIKSSFVYRIMAKILPESVVLAKWHAQHKNKEEKMMIKHLKKDEKELRDKSNEVEMTTIKGVTQNTEEQALNDTSGLDGPLSTTQDVTREDSAVQELSESKVDINNNALKDDLRDVTQNSAEQKSSESQITLHKESDTVSGKMEEVEVQQANPSIETTSL